MQRRLIFTPSAQQDLRDIYNYTLTTWGADQAKRYLNLLRERYRMLEMLPNLGKPLSEVSEQVRMIQCEHHYAYYQVGPEAIVFIAFLHESMDRLRHIIARLGTPH